jgi:hypothetical protein
MSFIDLIGQRFGKLLVISMAEKSKKGQAKWDCLCDCGNKIISIESCLKRGIIKSCGCKRKNFFKGTSFNQERFIDLTGQRFGKLRVISLVTEKNYRGSHWNCLCDCGNNHVVSGSNLRRSTKSCGCINILKMEALVGQKFGKLTVISLNEKKTPKQGTSCICLCDCGNKTIVYANNLKSGGTKSCGCSKKYADKTLSSKNALFYKYRKSSEKRKISFKLSFEDFLEIIQQDCFYCGKVPSQYFKAPEAQGGFYYNGIDRLDSKGPYVQGNIVACCKECNYLKWDRNKDEFIEWLKKCYNYSNLGKI